MHACSPPNPSAPPPAAPTTSKTPPRLPTRAAPSSQPPRRGTARLPVHAREQHHPLLQLFGGGRAQQVRATRSRYGDLEAVRVVGVCRDKAVGAVGAARHRDRDVELDGRAAAVLGAAARVLVFVVAQDAAEVLGGVLHR
eukprot:scaffold19746_cov67-Phaeocystis_antarctica.AAC.3